MNNLNIENDVKLLASNYRYNLEDIDSFPELNKAYDHVRSGEHDKQSIIKAILKQYRPSHIEPGTVGCYLFGCFQQTHGEISSNCSPLCMDSIQNSDMSVTNCRYQIWIQTYEDGYTRFKKLGNNNNSDKSYIYVNQTFTGFYPSEFNIFKKAGIEQAQIMVTTGLKHHSITKMSRLENLPINSTENTSIRYLTPKSENISFDDGNDNMIYYIAIAAVFVIIVVYGQYK